MSRYLIRTKIGLLTIGLCMAAVFSGCSDSGEEEESRVVVEQEKKAVEYKLTLATMGDIISTKNVRCEYTQLNSQDLSFAVSGKLVSKVYVKDGDAVKKGQLLAELSGGDRADEIEQLEYQINRNKLLLSQIDDTENYEISRRWLENIYHGDRRATDTIDDMKQSNEYTREDYRDAIALDEKQLAKIKTEVRQSKLYAGIDGTVFIPNERLEGSTTVRNEVVMQVKDNSECFFEVTDMSLRDYIKEGDVLELQVMIGPGAGSYKVEPYDMGHWSDRMLFAVVEGGDSAVFEAGNYGNLTIEMDSKKQVLTIPTIAVHSAGDKWYVYIVNDSGVRETKWIEIGLQSNEFTEIVSGLTEGEKVVLK